MPTTQSRGIVVRCMYVYTYRTVANYSDCGEHSFSKLISHFFFHLSDCKSTKATSLLQQGMVYV